MVAPAPRDQALADVFANPAPLVEPPSAVRDLIAAVLANRPAWMRDGLCAEYGGTVNFFPTQGEPVRPAKAVCAECLVVAECRSWALAQGAELDGIWAGTTNLQRKQMRAARPQAPPPGSVTIVATGPGGRSTAA